METYSEEIALLGNTGTYTDYSMADGWYYGNPVFNYSTYSALCATGNWNGGLVLDWEGIQIGDEYWIELLRYTGFPSSYWVDKLEDVMRFTSRLLLQTYSGCPSPYEEGNQRSGNWKAIDYYEYCGDAYEEYFWFRPLYVLGLSVPEFNVSYEMAVDILTGIYPTRYALQLIDNIHSLFYNHVNSRDDAMNGRKLYLAQGDSRNEFYMYHDGYTELIGSPLIRNLGSFSL